MLTPREEIEAARDAMQARLDRVVTRPWQVADDNWAIVHKHRLHSGQTIDIAIVPELHGDNADLIVAAVNREQRVIDHVTNVLARHYLVPDGCYPEGCCGGCGRYDNARSTHRYTVEDCPEVASVHAMVVGP